MRAIILNTAAIDNSGQRHEAGKELKVGTGKSEISSERAEQLLARALCAEVPKAAAKGGDASTAAAAD
jgi:hypothetical protein